MAAYRFQKIEHGILRMLLQSTDHLGHPTSLSSLTTFFRPTFADIDNRELVEALKRLRPKYLTLCKYLQGQLSCLEYPTQIADDEEFFYRGDGFRMRRTPETDPRAQELAATIEQQEVSRKGRFEHLEKLGLDRVKHDLLNGGLRWVGGTLEQQEEAWEWVRMKENQKPANSDATPRELSRKVFVVHGHDEAAREKIARFLERLDFQPIILHEQASRGRTVIEKVEAHSDVGFAVVLLTPDDEGCEKGGTPRPRARQNVVLELGYFVGKLGRTHVCALKRGEIEIPSDFQGVVYVPFDNSDGWNQALGRELEAAGFAVDWNKAMGTNA
jgi:predicted nucleotide-binding protein